MEKNENIEITQGKPSQRRTEEIIPFTVIETIRIVPQTNVSRQQPPGEQVDCCFTFIKFKKLYPDDVTARATGENGQNIERKFTKNKATRTLYVRKKKDVDEEPENQDVIIKGGLGRCVNIDIQIFDTSTIKVDKTTNKVQMITANYHFRLCCNDPSVRRGTRLTHREMPGIPGGQAVKLPLLEIVEIKRDVCP